MKQFTSNPFYKFILFPIGQMAGIRIRSESGAFCSNYPTRIYFSIQHYG